MSLIIHNYKIFNQMNKKNGLNRYKILFYKKANKQGVTEKFHNNT